MAVDYAGATVEWVTGTTTLLQLVKDKLGITDASQDDELSMYLDMAGVACETYIDNKLVAQPVKESIAWVASPIALRYWPANTLTLVEIDGEDVTTEWELMTTDGVVWTLNSRESRTCPNKFTQMYIDYTAGYDPLPSDAAYAICATAISYSTQSAGTGAVKKEVVQGVGSVEYVTDSESLGSVGIISGVSLGALERYRRWHV